MANYSVTFARSARKELEKLHPSMARRVMQRIEALATIPRPSGVIRLQGHKNLFESETIGSFLWSAIEVMRIVSSDKKLRLQTGDINRSIGSWNRGRPITDHLFL